MMVGVFRTGWKHVSYASSHVSRMAWFDQRTLPVWSSAFTAASPQSAARKILRRTPPKPRAYYPRSARAVAAGRLRQTSDLPLLFQSAIAAGGADRLHRQERRKIAWSSAAPDFPLADRSVVRDSARPP